LFYRNKTTAARDHIRGRNQTRSRHGDPLFGVDFMNLLFGAFFLVVRVIVLFAG
jgi:hypothetical protein